MLHCAKISGDLRTTFQQFMRVSVWEFVKIADSKLKPPFPSYVRTLTADPTQSLSELFFGDKRRGNPALNTPGTNIRERRSHKSSSKASSMIENARKFSKVDKAEQNDADAHYVDA